MPTAHFPAPDDWRKSSRSKQQGECVEVADLPAGIAVRDSKDQEGGILRLRRSAFAHLAARINTGEFDL
ncbi:DUF397 domain-containing protein [Actinomadura rudentiformis]|uniref:DUF397 domain-containing protein n=1 Tax=Actinomadura rudentiformis TaxID=359158 RepID=A0A6H9YXR2_9ACTN|nr:DUF397 domain-containing protein [Actinomadura rudentiformis]KAB2347384.1 DUF397 domain-containing protein [Actinomadura rudentiformis]